MIRVGEKRKEGFWRVMAAIWLLPMSIILYAISLLAMLWSIIDIVTQLVFNHEGLPGGSWPAGLIDTTFEWQADVSSFVATGNTEMVWWPY